MELRGWSRLHGYMSTVWYIQLLPTLTGALYSFTPLLRKNYILNNVIYKDTAFFPTEIHILNYLTDVYLKAAASPADIS